MTEAIEAYRFNDAAGAIYRFVWNVYCDWYLELAKPVLLGEEGPAKAETRAMIAWARDEILKLLHPFMPFITEELWAVTAKRDDAAGADAMAAQGGQPVDGRAGADRHHQSERCRHPDGGARTRRRTNFPIPKRRPRSAGWSTSSPRSARCAPR